MLSGGVETRDLRTEETGVRFWEVCFLKRKLWRKIVLIGAVLGLLGGTLAGCGQSPQPTSGGPVVLHTL